MYPFLMQSAFIDQIYMSQSFVQMFTIFSIIFYKDIQAFIALFTTKEQTCCFVLIIDVILLTIDILHCCI